MSQPIAPPSNLRVIRPQGRKNVGEVAGGTAAECAAVCCCCPFTVMNILVLAVYKVPAGVCRKAWRKQKKSQLKAKRKHKGGGGGLLTAPTTPPPIGKKQEGSNGEEKNRSSSSTTNTSGSQKLDLDGEVWDQFHTAGFWRTGSGDHVHETRTA